VPASGSRADQQFAEPVKGACGSLSDVLSVIHWERVALELRGAVLVAGPRPVSRVTLHLLLRAMSEHLGQVARAPLRSNLPNPLSPEIPDQVAAAIGQHRFAVAVREHMRRVVLQRCNVAERADITASALNHVLDGRQNASLALMLPVAIAVCAIELVPSPVSVAELLRL